MRAIPPPLPSAGPGPQMKTPGANRGVPILSLASRSWPEVALPAKDAGPHAFRRRGVEPARTAARAAEVQQHAAAESRIGRLMLRLDLRVDDFHADIEVRHRVPYGSRTDAPDVEDGGGEENRTGEEVRRRTQEVTKRTDRRRTHDARRIVVVVGRREGAEHGRAQSRGPVVLERRCDRPHRGQLEADRKSVV